MKKLTALTLAAVLALGLAACGKNAEKAPEAAGPETALELMNTVWESYPEEERFAIVGGDFDEANLTDGAPGVFGIEEADMLDNTLGFPTVEEGVEAAMAAKADIVVLCSSDDEYAEYAVPAFQAVNGRAMFIVGGGIAWVNVLKVDGNG